MEVTLPGDQLGVVLKVGLYVFLAILGLMFFPGLILSAGAGVMIASVLGTFSASAVANAVTIRVFERGRLADIGMGWPPGSARNLVVGIVAGIAAALLVLLPPLIAGAATLEKDPAQANGWPSILF